MKHVNLQHLNTALSDDYDLFICSSSFEGRCLSAPNRLKKKHFSRVVIIENKYGCETILQNTQNLCNYFKGKAEVLSVDYSNPIEIADGLISVMKRKNNGNLMRILVDITTFTHETLMILYKIAHVKKNRIKVTYLYTNATDYCPGSDVEKKWLSRGCRDIHAILGYSGLLFPSQKTRLIVVVGYEYTRAAEVITALEPNYLTLVYGAPDKSTTEKNKNANKLYSELIQQMAFDFTNIESIEIPCDNPDMTAEILCNLYKSHPDENIIVIPMNNKLSTIGVGKSIIISDHVQACYAPAVVYNESDYSIPGNNCYIYE